MVVRVLGLSEGEKGFPEAIYLYCFQLVYLSVGLVLVG